MTDRPTDGQTDRQNGYLVEEHRVNACLLDAPLQGDVSPFDREISGCGHLLLHGADFIHRGQPVTHADREALALVPDGADFVGVAIKEGFRQIRGLRYGVVKVSSIYHRPKENLEDQKCRQHFVPCRPLVGVPLFTCICIVTLRDLMRFTSVTELKIKYTRWTVLKKKIAFH